MPARKSNVSATQPEEGSKSAYKDREEGLSIEDLNLPKSIVQRLSKGVLPPNTQIQKDAILAMSKSATVFVNYLTSQAAENASRSNKKTVMPRDVFEAMHELEFESFLPRLEAEVQKFTSIQADKRNSYRKKIREEKRAQKEGGEAAPHTVNGHPVDDDTPPTKRVRRTSLDNGEHATGSDEEPDVDETVDEIVEEDDEPEDDEIEEEPADEGLAEDPLEDREKAATDDDMADGDESD